MTAEEYGGRISTLDAFDFLFDSLTMIFLIINEWQL
jgi:hypothetical protein